MKLPFNHHKTTIFPCSRHLPLVPTTIHAQWDWGDGAFVDNDAQQCTVRTGAARQRMRAKVTRFKGAKVGREELDVCH